MSSYDQFHRRRSFSGGFPGNSLAPPAHSDGGYRYNDPYNSNYQEPFSSGGSFPSSAGMPSSYPLGTPYSNSYDNSPLSDNQFANLDDGFSRGRTLSTGGGVSFGPSAIIPSAPPMTPYPSHYSGKRMRRASSVGPGAMGFAGIVGDPYHRPGGNVTIKFRLKGSNHHGISVAEALERVRLSQGNSYLMHDIAPDMYGKISLKVRWSGYRSNTYNMPLSADYHGYVDLQSLARRTSRAIVHFMQSNGISLPWNRVVIHRLEEISPGIWIPVLTTH